MFWIWVLVLDLVGFCFVCGMFLMLHGSMRGVGWRASLLQPCCKSRVSRRWSRRLGKEGGLAGEGFYAGGEHVALTGEGRGAIGEHVVVIGEEVIEGREKGDLVLTTNQVSADTDKDILIVFPLQHMVTLLVEYKRRISIYTALPNQQI